jgi:putative transposase
MVAAVRRGRPQRAVARAFGVSLRTVQVWVARATGLRLDRVDWSARPPGSRVAINRTAAVLEQRIVALREELRATSVLGEYGAAAIHRALTEGGSPERLPTVRTLGRILARRGCLDGHHRVRRPPPPRGWYVPEVGAGHAEVDLFDVIEDLKLAQGPRLDVLTGVSLHGGLPGAWPLPQATTDRILGCLAHHWRAVGRPAYAQFDNDTRFQGPHQHPDVFGRVVRFCLQLGVTPIFAPPREFGLQNPIEHFNGLFQRKVWRRFHFDSPEALGAQTEGYLAARRQRLAARIEAAPPRRPWPGRWEFHPEVLPAGRVIFIRRTTADGTLALLGHTWVVDRQWSHRLVRAEIDLGYGTLTGYGLRRQVPEDQRCLGTWAYRYPRDDLAR